MLALVLALSLSSCGGSSQQITTPVETTQEEFIGVVKPLGVSIYQEGTHRLESNGRLVAILESKTFGLAAFEEAEVKVGGKVRATVEGAQKIMNVETLEILKPAKERIKMTQTYISPYHSFRFEYSPDWKKMDEDKDKVTFGYEGKTEVLVTVSIAKLTGEFSEWLKKIVFEGFTSETENIFRVDNQNATRKIFRNDKGDQLISVSFPSDGSVYHFVYDGRAAKDATTDKGAFYDLLDSFSFQVNGAGTNVMTTPVSSTTSTPSTTTTTTPTTTSISDTSVVLNQNVNDEMVQRVLAANFASYTASGAFKFGFSIPKSWYYSGFAGVSGVIYRYGLTDSKTYKDSGDDVNLANTIATIDIVSGKFEDVRKGSATKLGEKDVYTESSKTEVTYYFKRDDKTTFVIKGYLVLKPVLEKIVASISLM